MWDINFSHQISHLEFCIQVLVFSEKKAEVDDIHEYLLLKGLVQNFSTAQTDLLLNILVTKDFYVHESLVDYFKSENDLRCFVSLF